MNDYARPSSSRNLINELTVQNEFLRAQIQSLNIQITDLKAENTALRSSATSHWAPQFAQVHNALRYNTLALPAAIESLAIMQQHFHRQGTLRQCSTEGCRRFAFDQICFREGHMSWCATHNRIITGIYTSCSVKSEDRHKCMPVSWEDRHDWHNIVDRAFYDGRIGNKGLEPSHLDSLLFPPPQTTACTAQTWRAHAG
ncbi:hypothetical protein B5807_01689 [Epicoccum nigrum]|uniref:Uncharacterized protein n=1 Tax=Epicoccum nigrum TaxID=105696 RepID=A0A1Y2MD77_EPING|nr:hypothetical protein B5807_01689 [Epicoccum nigrum]